MTDQTQKHSLSILNELQSSVDVFQRWVDMLDGTHAPAYAAIATDNTTKDEGNSFTQSLDADEIVYGTGVDVTQVAEIAVNVVSNVVTAADGIRAEASADNITWHGMDEWEINEDDLSTLKTWKVQKQLQYFRLVYENGSGASTNTIVSVFLSKVLGIQFSHRLDANVSGVDDAGLQKAVLAIDTGNEIDFKNVGIHNPIPTATERVYVSDIEQTTSSSPNWTGGENDDVTDLFNDRYEVLTNASADNPKSIVIELKRAIQTSIFGLSTFTGSFSNTKMIATVGMGVDAIEFVLLDESTDNTLKTLLLPQLAPATFNKLEIQFHTANTCSLSVIEIAKSPQRIVRQQGISSLTGLVEDGTTYRGALNVNSAWVHRKIVNETFHQDQVNVENLAIAASEGDTSITVDDGSGFAVGEEVQIQEGATQEIGIITLTGVAGNVLTLDRPIGNDYTTAATVTEVITDMAVAGTLANPEAFEVKAPVGTVWQLTRILISLVHAGAGDDGKFGGIAALTNGVALRATTSAGRTVTFANWKTNGDMRLDMYDVTYTDKAPGGANGTGGRWTFTRSEVVAELDGDASPVQKMEVLVQDPLQTLTSFHIRAQGRVFSP